MKREYQIMKLPSGFWAVFYLGEWLTASLRSADDCTEYIKAHRMTMKKQISK